MKFAQHDVPDFIIMKEALIVFETMILNQKVKHESKQQSDQVNITDEQKEYLFGMIKVIVDKFGTSDLEWFCAAETILNALFNIKSRNSHEYAKMFVEQLVRKLYLLPKNERSSRYQPESMADANEDQGFMSAEGLPLRKDLSELHYAQLFFVVGHVAIKMLNFTE